MKYVHFQALYYTLLLFYLSLCQVFIFRLSQVNILSQPINNESNLCFLVMGNVWDGWFSLILAILREKKSQTVKIEK